MSSETKPPSAKKGDSPSEESVPLPAKPSVEGLLPEDYEWDEQGRLVFTRAYHLKRGFCCQSGCRHCPY